MLTLLSQIAQERSMFGGPMTGWGLGAWIIFVVAICAAIGIAYVVMTQVFEVTPPAWLIKIGWIVIAACVAIFAIRLVLSM